MAELQVMAGFRKDGFITSVLSVQHDGEAPREVRHYWYDSWPDHGVPDLVEPLITMVRYPLPLPPSVTCFGSPLVLLRGLSVSRSHTGSLKLSHVDLHVLFLRGHAATRKHGVLILAACLVFHQDADFCRR